MLNIVSRTRLSPEEAVKKAVEFFGPGGQGMEVKEQSADCAYFEGAGGGVEVTACVEGKETSVTFISREWDYQVKEFIREVLKQN